MVDVLVFGSHPDDIEFGCGGILAKLAAEGKEILIADLTLGEKGTHGVPEIRRLEGDAAAGMIGAKRLCLNFPDCGVIDSYEGRLELVKVIRTYRPKLILAPFWKGEQNHPDHLATGSMARYACRYARFEKILPELPIHWVEGILHYPPFSWNDPDFLIDVSPYVDTWRRMMECHASQMKTFNYADWNLRQASKLGMMIGKEYAQGLVKGNPVVIDDLFSISKGTREI